MDGDVQRDERDGEAQDRGMLDQRIELQPAPSTTAEDRGVDRRVPRAGEPSGDHAAERGEHEHDDGGDRATAQRGEQARIAHGSCGELLTRIGAGPDALGVPPS